MDPITEEASRKQSEFCDIFGNALRVRILWALARGEMSVSKIAGEVNASLQNTSHHLHLMKDRGILSFRREGKSVLYRIGDFALVDCLLQAAPAAQEPIKGDQEVHLEVNLQKEKES